MSPEDIAALQSSLTDLALKVYPDRIHYVGQSTPAYCGPLYSQGYWQVSYSTISINEETRIAHLSMIYDSAIIT